MTALAAPACGQSGADTAADKPPASVTAPTPAPIPSLATQRPAAKTVPTKFAATIESVSRADVPYSWRPGCPVSPSGLRLIKMTYWGFDKRPHRGELVVNAQVAKDVVKVFRKLYRARYPIRRMLRVDVYKGSDFASIEANNTSAFNCRPATGSRRWSQHAYGLAIDINPCENPYVSAAGHVSHPRCVRYADRSRRAPGMIHEGDVVVRAFGSIGWGWGGRWSGVKDYQHFSSTGR